MGVVFFSCLGAPLRRRQRRHEKADEAGNLHGPDRLRKRLNPPLMGRIARNSICIVGDVAGAGGVGIAGLVPLQLLVRLPARAARASKVNTCLGRSFIVNKDRNVKRLIAIQRM